MCSSCSNVVMNYGLSWIVTPCATRVAITHMRYKCHTSFCLMYKTKSAQQWLSNLIKREKKVFCTLMKCECTFEGDFTFAMDASVWNSINWWYQRLICAFAKKEISTFFSNVYSHFQKCANNFKYFPGVQPSKQQSLYHIKIIISHFERQYMLTWSFME